ncbi:SHOCT domain-containing protein [Hymenobacter sp. DG01]|uniref:SHOCT domain-containing protein n=1 Tax=Hymenobacter sp. DG01 TaxID=2584940 RepID=UPI00111F2418|nr:SHOCT domain-containing protein [Hymenobacter sp. DG01]
MKFLGTIISAGLGLLATTHAHAQKPEEYKASNNITYHPGDTIRLGRGSAPNGDFRYLQVGGWGAAMANNPTGNRDFYNAKRSLAGLAVVVKKINTRRLHGQATTTFTVGAGTITNFNLLIEEAIASCEVAACKSAAPETAAQPQPDKYDRLNKIKALLDNGTLTQTEYESEKAKILAGQ